MDQRPIGFFDSGLGGLTCVRAFRERLPQEQIIYFGDTARTPYGSKAVSTIRMFAGQMVEFLIRKQVKLIVIACNTVSATCLPWLREAYPEVPIIGIIQPMIDALPQYVGSGDRVAVIGTSVTIRSDVYQSRIKEQYPGLQVSARACPLFVPMIEEGIIDHPMIDLAIHHYLDDLVETERPQHLILGCTHYPLIQAKIASFYPGLQLLNPAEVIAETIVDYLRRHDMLAAASDAVSRFYASDLSDRFKEMISSIMEEEETAIRFKNFDLDDKQLDANT